MKLLSEIVCGKERKRNGDSVLLGSFTKSVTVNDLLSPQSICSRLRAEALEDKVASWTGYEERLRLMNPTPRSLSLKPKAICERVILRSEAYPDATERTQ